MAERDDNDVRSQDESESSGISRREFLTRAATAGAVLGAGGALGAGLPHVFAAGTPATPKMLYRTLGRTKHKVSLLSLGAMQVTNPGVVHRAIDRGMNYIDTAAGYQGGNNETMLGEVMKTRRKEVFLATKWQARRNSTKEQLMESCNTSLRRLQTDRIDLIQTHGVGSTEMVTLPAVREAFLELKKQGKVRFMGFTNHTQNATLIQDGIATGWYDAILIAYNFMSPPALAAVLTKAKKANVGVVIMKSVAAAAKNAQVVELAAAKQLSPHVAAIKWVMANADVSTCNVGMTTFDQVDEDVTALRGPIQRAESELIEQMRVAVAGNYCQMCEACTPSCPQGIAIADSLRCLMYRESYGNAQLAAENYASVPAARRAGNCTQCGACDHACPFGLRIANRIQQAHRALA